MRPAWSLGYKKTLKTAIITKLLIPKAVFAKSEVNKYEYCITEYMPADERPLDGCRREGQGDFPKAPKGGVQNPFNEP